MKKVFKYPLGAYQDVGPFMVAVNNLLKVKLPKDHQILHVGLQGGSIMMWVLVDPESELCEKKIWCVGTGHEITEGNLRFIDTVHLMKDSFILHFFEVLE